MPFCPSRCAFSVGVLSSAHRMASIGMKSSAKLEEKAEKRWDSNSDKPWRNSERDRSSHTVKETREYTPKAVEENSSMICRM